MAIKRGAFASRSHEQGAMTTTPPATTDSIGGTPVNIEYQAAYTSICERAYDYFMEKNLDATGWHFMAALARPQDESAPARRTLTVYATKPGVQGLAFVHVEPGGDVLVQEFNEK